MPSQLKRYQHNRQHHFITFSCDDRRPYLSSEAAKAIFESELEKTRMLYSFEVAGYVIMPEHVHLLVSEPPETSLGTAVGVLKRNVSRKLPQNPFWLPRYHDFNVSSNEKLIEKLRYSHRNPIDRGLVSKPEDYHWSSYRTYARLDPGVVTITRCI